MDVNNKQDTDSNNTVIAVDNKSHTESRNDNLTEVA